MKELCVKLSGIGALLICGPVIYRISQGDVFNPASFFLWSALALVSTIVLVRAKKGGHVLIAGYFLSDLIIGICAYRQTGQMKMEAFEWFVLAITATCTIIYLICELRGNLRPAVISNAAALMMAGMPQLIDFIQHPHQTSFVICGLYMLINVLGFYGERTFNGKLIGGLSIIYWTVIIVGVGVNRM